MISIHRILTLSARFAVAAATVPLFFSCARSLSEPVPEPRASLTIRLTVPAGAHSSASTYATEEAGYDFENTIDLLYIRFYSRNVAEQGTNAPWTQLGSPLTLSPGDPRFPNFSSSNSSEAITFEGLDVTKAALEGGNVELMVIIWANYDTAQPQTAISDEGSFFTELQTSHLFFSGSATFAESPAGSGYWIARVGLARQVAKLRVRATIHPDAVPSTLAIAPESISVEVSRMADRSAVTLSDGTADPGVSSPGTVGYGISRTAPSAENNTSLRMQRDANGQWQHGFVIDSLYMHPHAAATEADATIVKVSMRVEDYISGEQQVLYTEYPLRHNDAYALQRNTIYTLNLQVQSIKDESLKPQITIDEWAEEETEIPID